MAVKLIRLVDGRTELTAETNEHGNTLITVADDAQQVAFLLDPDDRAALVAMLDAPGEPEAVS